MKQICQRHLSHIKNLEQDFYENVRHFQETGQDEDLIPKAFSEIMAIIASAPDETDKRRLPVGPGQLRVYTPQDPAVYYGRFGHAVIVDQEMAEDSGTPRYGRVFKIHFVEDGYEALAYEDELEEV